MRAAKPPARESIPPATTIAQRSLRRGLGTTRRDKATRRGRSGAGPQALLLRRPQEAAGSPPPPGWGLPERCAADEAHRRMRAGAGRHRCPHGCGHHTTGGMDAAGGWHGCQPGQMREQARDVNECFSQQNQQHVRPQRAPRCSRHAARAHNHASIPPSKTHADGRSPPTPHQLKGGSARNCTPPHSEKGGSALFLAWIPLFVV